MKKLPLTIAGLLAFVFIVNIAFSWINIPTSIKKTYKIVFRGQVIDQANKPIHLSKIYFSTNKPSANYKEWEPAVGASRKVFSDSIGNYKIVVPVVLAENAAYAAAASKNEEIKEIVNFWLTYIYKEYDTNKQVKKLLYATHQVSESVIIKLGNNKVQESYTIPPQQLKIVEKK